MLFQAFSLDDWKGACTSLYLQGLTPEEPPVLLKVSRLLHAQMTHLREKERLTTSIQPAWLREKEREREIHYVHSASLAYEDGIVFMSEPSAARQ